MPRERKRSLLHKSGRGYARLMEVRGRSQIKSVYTLLSHTKRMCLRREIVDSDIETRCREDFEK